MWSESRFWYSEEQTKNMLPKMESLTWEVRGLDASSTVRWVGPIHFFILLIILDFIYYILYLPKSLSSNTVDAGNDFDCLCRVSSVSNSEEEPGDTMPPENSSRGRIACEPKIFIIDQCLCLKRTIAQWNSVRIQIEENLYHLLLFTLSLHRRVILFFR